jgi:[ribosomal protein S18]-alanine N-acetyltransferase
MPDRIRRARASDLDALLRLEAKAFEPHRRASARSLARSLLSPHQEVWVIEEGAGALAALLVLWKRPRTWRVYDIAVAPHRQGQGLAGRLMHHAEARASKAGAGTMALEAQQSLSDLVAKYKRWGYQEARRRPDYYAPGRHAVRMVKRLH